MDFSKLEEELNGLIEADNLYWVRNDAKFRAARQNVSYEEFEQIVKVTYYTFYDYVGKLTFSHFWKMSPKLTMYIYHNSYFNIGLSLTSNEAYIFMEYF